MSGEIIGVSALRDMLPCRPSMLLLDRVFVESENKLIGLKSISMNEPFFMGHFPGHPILPGVLQVEAIASLQRSDSGNGLIRSAREIFISKNCIRSSSAAPTIPATA